MKKYVCLIIALWKLGYYSNAQEMRTSGAIKFSVTPKTLIETEFQLRSERTSFKTNAFLSELSLKQNLTKRINVSTGYRYSSCLKNAERLTTPDTDDKSRYNIDIAYDLPIFSNPWDSEYRLRFQLSSKGKDKQKYYLRNKLQFKYKIQKGFRTNISEEVYLDAKNQSFKLNKIQIGTETKISKSIELEFYFINELEIKKKEYVYFNYTVGITITITI